MPFAVPEELVQQFRTVALERLDRIEASWGTALSVLDDQAGVVMHRELHTLKGESKMLGFADVNLVCHKLEDMLEVARNRGYAVDEDFDLAVNMAIRFMAMLVRKKVGAQLGGIDLPGFIKQIDNILAEIRPEQKTRASNASKPPASAPRVPHAVRGRLAPIAVDAFIEYAAARGTRRDRLRASWHGLRDLIGSHRAIVGPGQLAKHKAGCEALARELGKRIDLVFDISPSEATGEVLGAVDMAILHLVRNAIDHGIEQPTVRTAAGKSPHGTIRVQCNLQGDQLFVTVTDDGRGVSLDEVRARAIDVGLLAPNDTEIEGRWFDLVCQPGFTTRAQASDISGRGIGVDAVRAGIHEVGGTFTATTTAGHGTSWRIEIPVPKMTFEAHVLRAPGVPFPILIDASWKQVEPTADAPVIDIAHRLGLVDDRAANAMHYFRRDDRTLGVIAERPLQLAGARRLIVTPPPALADIVMLEAVEGLLLHLDRIR